MERQHLRLPEDHGGKIFRTSHRRCFLNKGGFKNFEKFTEKHLRQSLFFNKAEGLACKKKDRCFTVSFTKCLRAPFLQETSGRLLLNITTFALGSVTEKTLGE